jgi:hypothetical protein
MRKRLHATVDKTVRKIEVVFFICLIVFMTTACVGPAPVDDYNLAYTAMNSAKKAGASRFATGYLAKANDYYKEAQKFYKDRDYQKASIAFKQAKLFAERAENLSALKRAQTGEVPE